MLLDERGRGILIFHTYERPNIHDARLHTDSISVTLAFLVVITPILRTAILLQSLKRPPP